MTNTEDVVYGADLMIFIKDGTEKKPIAYATSIKIDRTMKPRDTSSKTDGKNGSKRPGKHEWNASADCFLSYGELFYSHKQLIEAYNADNKLELTWGIVTGDGTNVLDDAAYTEKGEAFITALGIASGTDDNATVNVSFEGVGGITPTDPV